MDGFLSWKTMENCRHVLAGDKPMNNKRTGDEQGSMTLEYVIMLAAAVPVLKFWLSIFEPGNGYTELGLKLVDFFKRILVGISLPIP